VITAQGLETNDAPLEHDRLDPSFRRHGLGW
jgi:hypothetical protein